MTTKLYPLKFKPIFKNTIWGGTKLNSVLKKQTGNIPNVGESWELSGVKDNVSLVGNGFLQGNDLNELIEVYMGDLVGDKVYSRFGNEFPLLIKFIDAREALSIQVHPGDELAAVRHSSFGKTEMWYVMQADKDAYLISGFKEEIKPEQYVKAVEQNSLEKFLAKHVVTVGDVFFMPAGRVHAIGAGILLAEIQQASDITYRIYDFNRKDKDGNSRELHVEQAMDVIDYKVPESYKTKYSVSTNKVSKVVESRYFITGIIEADKPIGLDYYHLDSFVIFICIDGKAEIVYGDGLKVDINKGETALIPAELKQINLVPVNKTRILEVYIP